MIVTDAIGVDDLLQRIERGLARQLRRAAQQQQGSVNSGELFAGDDFKAFPGQVSEVIRSQIKGDEFAPAITEAFAIQIDPVAFVERGAGRFAFAADAFPLARIVIKVTVASIVAITAIIGDIVAAAIIVAACGAIVVIVAACCAIVITARCAVVIATCGTIVVATGIIAARVVSSCAVSSCVVTADVVPARIIPARIIPAYVIAARFFAAGVSIVRITDITVVIPAVAVAVIIVITIARVLREQRRHQGASNGSKAHRHRQQAHQPDP